MRDKEIRNWVILLPAVFFLFQSCIHEYPHANRRFHPGVGEVPETVNAFVEVTYNLSWERMLYNVGETDDTRSRTNFPHRFVIEVAEDGETVSHEMINISDNEFLTGRLNHRIGVTLQPHIYTIAVWYDCQDSEGNYSFDTDRLDNVAMTNHSTTDASALQCACASDVLDLREFAGAEEVEVSKSLDLSYPGARFEIVASDVQEFITEQKEALNNGEKFYVRLSFREGVAEIYDVYAGWMVYKGTSIDLTGWMRLPFAEYTELKIAEGFLFCREQDTVNVKLSVLNSAMVTVSQTDYFSFPIRRGYITVVTGNFLTHPIDGIFSIDNIWDEDIVIEI